MYLLVFCCLLMVVCRVIILDSARSTLPSDGYKHHLAMSSEPSRDLITFSAASIHYFNMHTKNVYISI